MMLELTDSPFDVHDRKSQRFRQSDEARMDKGTWKAFERICSWEPGSLQAASDSMLPMAQKCFYRPFFCLCVFVFVQISRVFLRNVMIRAGFAFASAEV